MATPYRPSRTLWRAAKRRHASSSVASVAYGYERSAFRSGGGEATTSAYAGSVEPTPVRPRLACFSRPESTIWSAGDR